MIQEPYLIVAESPAELLLISADAEQSPMTDAVVYNKSRGMVGLDVKPVAVWAKFLSFLEEVYPPVPFTLEEARRRST